MMTWTWRFLGSDGEEMAIESGPVGAEFPTQSDAETWLGETWRELGEAGIASVTLLNEGREVYGPMSLEPPE